MKIILDVIFAQRVHIQDPDHQNVILVLKEHIVIFKDVLLVLHVQKEHMLMKKVLHIVNFAKEELIH
jgi:hypothetical protein